MHGTEIKVSKLPNCELCTAAGGIAKAAYDAKTKMGPWAFMCDRHFKEVGPGMLGEGIGQKLVLR